MDDAQAQLPDDKQRRARVLRMIQAVVGTSPQAGKVQGRMTFCPQCGRDISHANATPGQTIHCSAPTCGYVGDRAFIFDTQILWCFNQGEYATVPHGELIHFAVGAVIQRADCYLLIRRTLYPSGIYTIPAGHLEQGESPAEAVSKEVFEETGMTVTSHRLLLDRQVLLDDCRRSVDYHVWSLYACDSIGEPRMNYEADQIGWYPAAALQTLPLGMTTRRLLLPLVNPGLHSQK